MGIKVGRIALHLSPNYSAGWYHILQWSAVLKKFQNEQPNKDTFMVPLNK